LDARIGSSYPNWTVEGGGEPLARAEDMAEDSRRSRRPSGEYATIALRAENAAARMAVEGEGRRDEFLPGVEPGVETVGVRGAPLGP